MSRAEYYQGIEFIKQNSGTLEEEKQRLKQWSDLALPLVGKTPLTASGRAGIL